MGAIIFDLDQTLIDSSIAEGVRKKRDWPAAYKLIPKFSLYPNTSELLSFVKRAKLKTAIVSSSPRPYCEKVLAFWKIDYDVLVGFHDTLNRKPHADPMLKAVRELKTRVEDTISFGDSRKDIMSSHNAGISSVACLWGCTEELSSLNPSYKVNTTIEAIEILRRHFRLEDV